MNSNASSANSVTATPTNNRKLVTLAATTNNSAVATGPAVAPLVNAAGPHQAAPDLKPAAAVSQLSSSSRYV